MTFLVDELRGIGERQVGRQPSQPSYFSKVESPKTFSVSSLCSCFCTILQAYFFFMFLSHLHLLVIGWN